MCKGSGTNTVQTNSQPPAAVMQAYQNLISRGTNVANQPLQPYGGPLIAGFNPQQGAAFGAVNQAATAANPYINAASGYAALGASPIWPNVTQFSPGAVQQFENPYTQDVINSTMANVNQQNQIQQSYLESNAIRSGASPFGGDRAGVAAAALANQQALASNQTIAGLENQKYAQALGAFQQQQGTQLQGLEGDAWRQANAAYTMGNLGSEAQNTGLAGASAMMNVGGLEQQLQQEQLNIPYEQYLQAQAYPFQTTNFLGNLVEGVGGASGGTSSTTSPSPSTLSQIAGLGMTGLGILGATGGFGAGGWLAGLGLRRGGRINRPRYASGGGLPAIPDITSPVGDTGSGFGASRVTIPAAPSPVDTSSQGASALGDALAMLKETGALGADGWLTKMIQNKTPMGEAQAAEQAAISAGLPFMAAGTIAGPVRRGGRIRGYDEGGAIPDANPNVAPPVGISSDPQMQQFWQKYASMPLEQLQRLSVMTPPTTPQGQLIRKAMMQKRMAPASTAPAQTPPQQSGFGAPAIANNQAALAAQQPTGYADGGATDLGMGPMTGGLPYSWQDPNVAQAYGVPVGPYPTPTKLTAAPPDLTRSPVTGQKSTGVVPAPEQTAQGVSTIPRPPTPSSSGAAGAVGAGGLAGGSQDTSGGLASSPPAGGGDLGAPGGFAEKTTMSPWAALARAGLATMGGESPFAAVNIGRGGLEGLNALAEQPAYEASLNLKRAEAEQAQANADVSRLSANAYKLMMRYAPTAFGGGGGDAGTTTADGLVTTEGAPGATTQPSGGDGTVAPPNAPAGAAGNVGQPAAGTGPQIVGPGPSPGTSVVSGIAPGFERFQALMRMAAGFGMIPQMQGLAEIYKTMAQADPDFIRSTGLLKEGYQYDPQRGGWILPDDVAHAFQQKSTAESLGKPQFIQVMGSDGKMHEQTYWPTSPSGSGAATTTADTTGQPKPGSFDAVAAQPGPEIKPFMPLFGQTEKAQGLPSNLLVSMGYAESHLNPQAISPKGAEGVMQLMPKTAAGEGVNAWNPTAAIPVAGKMMRSYLAKYSPDGDPNHGNLIDALAAYNWGPGHTDRWIAKTGGDVTQLPPETQLYALKVMMGMQSGPHPWDTPQVAQAAAAAAPAGGATTTTPPAGGGGENLGPTTGYAPGTEEEVKAQGAQAGDIYKENREDSRAAVTQNQILRNMLMEAKGFSQGVGADVVGHLQSWLVRLDPSAKNIVDAQGAWAAMTKNAVALTGQATKAVSPRASQQEMFFLSRALPSPEMTPQAFKNVTYQMLGATDYIAARNRLLTNPNSPFVKEGGHPYQFEDWVENKVSPMAFQMAEMDADTYKAAKAALMQDAQGRALMKQLGQEIKFIHENGLLYEPGQQ